MINTYVSCLVPVRLCLCVHPKDYEIFKVWDSMEFTSEDEETVTHSITMEGTLDQATTRDLGHLDQEFVQDFVLVQASSNHEFSRH